MPFGIALHRIRPLQPPEDTFLWNDDGIYPLPTIPSDFLRPAPAANPPPDLTYPQSPTWTLRRDHRFSRGCHYSADWSRSHSSLVAEREHILRLTTPPNTIPIWDAEMEVFVIRDIPGGVRLVPGIPMVQYLDGISSEFITIACLQTAQSLSQLPHSLEIEGLFRDLFQNTFGFDDGTIHIDPIYTLPGLKRNDRSAQPANKHTPDGRPCYDGSYSLAGTAMKGKGKGYWVPASQAVHEKARDQIATVLCILHRLYRLIMPHCVSKMEWDLMEFFSKLNNVFSFGGSEPGGTSVQMNVSSGFSGGDLRTMIGIAQGYWHLDSGDDLTFPTLFFLLFRLPKGNTISHLSLDMMLMCITTQVQIPVHSFWVVLASTRER